MLENQKDASDKSKDAVNIDYIVDGFTTGIKEKVLNLMDAHPDITRTQKIIHGGGLGTACTSVAAGMRIDEAKEKYGKEEAVKIGLGQTLSSETMGMPVATACKTVPSPIGKLVCAIAGAVAVDYIHDNVEIIGKTINDHVGDYLKTKEVEEAVVATIPTGLQKPEPSPQNTTALSNSTDTNKANCDSLRDCKDVSTKGCDTSWLSSKKAIKQRYREMHGHGNGHGNNHDQGSGRAGGISNVKDSRGNDVRDSHGGIVQSGGYGPGGRSKL